MNITDSIETYARTRAREAAILAGSQTFTFSETDAAINRIATGLAARGLAPGHVVGTQLPSSPLHLLVVLALARMGAVLVVIHPSCGSHKLRSIVERFQLRALVGEVDPAISGCQWIPPEAAWLETDAPAKSYAVYPASAGHPWCIALTSGTTGTPKGVMRTHAEFLEISALQRPFMSIGPESRFLSRMGMHTQAILMRVLNHLHAGSAVVFGVGDLSQVLEDIDRHRVTHSFVSPAMLENWLKALQVSRRPFGRLTHLLVGGGGLSDTLRRQVARQITPGLMVSYGTTETWFAAIANAETLERYPGTAGRVLPWIEAQAVDEADRPLPAGESGVLRFRGRGVATGYHGVADDPAAMSKAFRNGWCYVGDIGRVTADRMLYIEDRVDEVINVGGPKINSSGVEQIVATYPGVEEVAAIGMTTPAGRKWLAVAVVARVPLDAERLLRHYQGRGGQYASLIRFVPVERMPRNDMGKIVKHELARWIDREVRSGALQPARTPDGGSA